MTPSFSLAVWLARGLSSEGASAGAGSVAFIFHLTTNASLLQGET
jgi:hypothetical protein